MAHTILNGLAKKLKELFLNITILVVLIGIVFGGYYFVSSSYDSWEITIIDLLINLVFIGIGTFGVYILCMCWFIVIGGWIGKIHSSSVPWIGGVCLAVGMLGFESTAPYAIWVPLVDYGFTILPVLCIWQFIIKPRIKTLKKKKAKS